MQITYKITEVQHLNIFVKTAQTYIIIEPETTRGFYNYIYFEDNTANGAKYGWYRLAQNKIKRNHPKHRTVCHRVTNKQKPRTFPST